MKARFLLLSFLFIASPGLATEKLEWTSKDALDAPKCAYYDPVTHYVFVSNVAGAPDKKDGRGWIARMTPSGKVVNARWLDGLNAPKGIRSRGSRLWVADIDTLLE